MDVATQRLLQDIFRRESRSLLQYLTESFPWMPPDKQAAVQQLQKLAEEELEGATKIANFLRRHHIELPYQGAFPMEYTNINFIGLDYAASLLIKDEQEAVGELQRDVDRLRDGEARRLVQETLREKQRHLKDLEKLATELPATTLR